jgi:hypothetical protein
MPFNSWHGINVKNKIQQAIPKGIPIEWYHF